MRKDGSRVHLSPAWGAGGTGTRWPLGGARRLQPAQCRPPITVAARWWRWGAAPPTAALHDPTAGPRHQRPRLTTQRPLRHEGDAAVQLRAALPAARRAGGQGGGRPLSSLPLPLPLHAAPGPAAPAVTGPRHVCLSVCLCDPLSVCVSLCVSVPHSGWTGGSATTTGTCASPSGPTAAAAWWSWAGPGGCGLPERHRGERGVGVRGRP